MRVMKQTSVTTDLQTATLTIKSGGVLAYPTESVWGLGCDPFNEAAFSELLRLKARPLEKGVILIAGELSQVAQILAHLPHDMQQRMMESWQTQSDLQQGITWLVPLAKHSGIPSWITGKHQSVAIRLTPHPLIKALCASVNTCLVSTSCNLAGSQPALTEAQARGYFGQTVNYLSGNTLGFEKPSRILDAKTGAILR